MPGEFEHFFGYGFEVPLFRAEILKKLENTNAPNYYVGYIQHEETKEFHPVAWDREGKCYSFVTTFFDISSYNLTPVKLEWYQKQDNIGKLCIAIQTGEKFILKKTVESECVRADRDLKATSGFDWIDVSKCRLATQDEVLQLLGS